ncbi:Membrane-bound transcription factor site-1 protease [Capsicum annuum]|uniref:Membrane-bound transcription factor site-1 protease n=1 Tax=Capsicum annuum TaxID=4072 RepID=A0A2G2ZPN9_CAPAN|nr:Membrane-bound transcription factor site-1 protease [Capsicum annuum]KAF3682288.1 Membrane-bound transcription factor site-1 protease [Capsicum annuum]PHT83956.1 Membrane-bound transcription factor site-1 protease [Capsicum annuum]
MVSAIGNDGPLYGTLEKKKNSRADQSDAIGVGSIDYSYHVALFSSRGMSTWEIPHGYGRVKPDLVAYGRDIMGSKISTGCKRLSGTSVTSPVVAGIVCLLVSIVPKNKRMGILNPASIKQALVEGATKLSGPNLYEQGAGRVNLLESYEILKSYKPRASIFPSVLDYTDCPYSWPFCHQPLYAGAMLVIFNATILDGMGVIGYVESPPTWHPSNQEGNLLSIRFTYSDVIWPCSGYLAFRMQINEEGSQFSGEIECNITVKIYSPPAVGKKSRQSNTCVLHLKLQVIPTPPRSLRKLCDQFHNIKYPPGYIPIDSFDVRNNLLDCIQIFTHYLNMLRDAGYYIEPLGSPLTCFDANQYGMLLLVDLEDEYFPEEIKKLRDDVTNLGLGVAVFNTDKYNVDAPVTGGANIPALNDLLATFGIAFGDKILKCFPFLDRSQRTASQNVVLLGMSKIGSPILGLLEGLRINLEVRLSSRVFREKRTVQWNIEFEFELNWRLFEPSTNVELEFEETLRVIFDTTTMEPKASNAQTMDNNAINLILARLETMSRDVAWLNVGLEKLDTDVASISGRLERVESQRSLPSTPQNISSTNTPETLHQMQYTPIAINQTNLYSRSQEQERPNHPLLHQVQQEGLGI